jgi:hypothetical protein
VQRAVERIQKIEKNYLISKTTLQIWIEYLLFSLLCKRWNWNIICLDRSLYLKNTLNLCADSDKFKFVNQKWFELNAVLRKLFKYPIQKRYPNRSSAHIFNTNNCDMLQLFDWPPDITHTHPSDIISLLLYFKSCIMHTHTHPSIIISLLLSSSIDYECEACGNNIVIVISIKVKT